MSIFDNNLMHMCYDSRVSIRLVRRPQNGFGNLTIKQSISPHHQDPGRLGFRWMPQLTAQTVASF